MNKIFAFTISILMMGVSSVTFAEQIYTYARLATKNLDDMTAIIQEHVKLATKGAKGDEVDPKPLEDALQAVFSRPNSDDMISKILDSVQSRFESDEQWESSMRHVVEDSISRLKNSKANSAQAQMTDVVCLTNVISEFRPAAKKGEEFEVSIIHLIRDAKIELSDEARAEGRERAMIPIESPSTFAETVLPVKEEKAAAKAKAKAEAEAAKAKKKSKEKSEDKSGNVPDGKTEDKP